MMLAHAIYGSATGLGDFGILASTPGLDERTRSSIVYYANLEGSARSTPFAPIFSFFALGENRWAFSRTLCLGPTRRGNDYLVHAIVLDAAALARIGYRPFALEDAGLFVSAKPAEGSVLKPLSPGGGGARAFHFDDTSIASCIRALARGPLRLRIEDDVQAAEVCREIHESLPPEDRVATTFCTRFSYGRNLGFQLAAFVSADEPRVRETAAGATIADFPPPAASAPDPFDRWAAEIRGHADLDLAGLSVVSDAREAFVLVEGVRQLRRWTAHDAAPGLGALEKASALVLRKENRGREVVQSVLPGALAVDLAARVRGGTAFDECARLCGELDPQVRRAAVQWLRELNTTPAEIWMAEMLLLLPDAPLAEISGALQRMQAENANVFRAFAAAVLARVRDRFGAEGASVAASAAQRLTGDMLLSYVRVMEEVAAGDTAWLLAIVRDVFAGGGIAAAIPARIILTSNLLPWIDDAEVETFAPAFFVMEEKLAGALAATQRPALYRALARVAQTRLLGGWTPLTPAASDIVRRVLAGAVEAGADNAALTTIVFLAVNAVPARDLVTAIEHIGGNGVTEAQAALLIRTLQTLGRRGTKEVSLRRRTLLTLLAAARRRAPQTPWNRMGWYLRVRTLREVAG